MTPENVERAIQFILEHQARYEASLEKTELAFEQTEKQIQKTQKQLDENAKQLGKTDAKIAELAAQTAAQNQVTSAQIRELKEACADLLDHARNTDVRLNRLEKPKR